MYNDALYFHDEDIRQEYDQSQRNRKSHQNINKKQLKKLDQIDKLYNRGLTSSHQPYSKGNVANNTKSRLVLDRVNESRQSNYNYMREGQKASQVTPITP